MIFASACRNSPPEPKPIQSAQAAPVAAPRGGEIEAELHFPSLEAGQKAPLLVLLHGLGSSGEELAAGSDWPRFAESHGIAWAAPSGPMDSQGRRFWDAGPSCCNFDGKPVDHVAALGNLLERLKQSSRIDASRVYVGGHSNGAFMAHRLACERPELVSGIVAVAGTGPLSRAACKPPTSLRVLQIHGDQDPIVTYGGGHLFRRPDLPEHLSAQKTAADWAKALGCEGSSAAAPLDVEARLPGAETRVDAFAHCRAGAVELWTVVGASHYVAFRNPAPEAVWAFLSR